MRATRAGVSRRPSRFGSSPTAARISRTARSIRGRSTCALDRRAVAARPVRRRGCRRRTPLVGCHVLVITLERSHIGFQSGDEDDRRATARLHSILRSGEEQSAASVTHSVTNLAEREAYTQFSLNERRETRVDGSRSGSAASFSTSASRISARHAHAALGQQLLLHSASSGSAYAARSVSRPSGKLAAKACSSSCSGNWQAHGKCLRNAASSRSCNCLRSAGESKS